MPHHDVDGGFGGLKLQTELLHECGEEIGVAFLPRARRRHECRRGTQECVSHMLFEGLVQVGDYVFGGFDAYG